MTHDAMAIDMYAHGYQDRLDKGQSIVEDEDEDFELDDVLAQIEREAEEEEAAERAAQAAVATVDDWEEVP